jgi:hypothetical protein
MIWGIGLSIYVVLYLIVIGVAVYFYRKKMRELRAKARTSFSPVSFFDFIWKIIFYIYFSLQDIEKCW